MADMVTQCPQCQTAFRVTESQLQAAHGAVRCGSCLHIFMAVDHCLSEITEEATASEAPANTQALNDDDLFVAEDNSGTVITDDMLEEIDQLIGDSAGEQLTDNFLSLESEQLNPKVFTEEATEEDNEEQVDENWARDLLREEADKPDYLNDFDEDLIDEEFPVYDSLDDPIDTPDDPADPLELPEREQQEDEAETEFIISDEIFTAGEPINSDEDRQALLASIQPEPVIFKDAADKTFWKKLGWTMALILGAVGLAGQYLHSNFDGLAKHPDFRGSYQLACDYLGCKLPAQQDISLLRTSNLIVRSHPDKKNALIMDTILTNHAVFPQVYPLLELRFTDNEGKVIAAGGFPPDQYLAGELLGSQQMPSQQPIHITLAIADPGPEAVNYQLLLRPNAKSNP